VLFAFLAAAVYFASVLFVLEDQGLATESDAVLSKVTLGCAGLLCAVGLLFSLGGLRQPGRRGSAALGFLLNAAFLTFVGFIFWRGG
jgi:hypothetical protein